MTRSRKPAGKADTESRTFLLAELHVSPLNVRKNLEDAQAIDALAESIAHRGLLEQLDTHPPIDGFDAPTAAGVIAGQRRLLAITKLHAEGRWPADRPIEALHHTGKTAAELIMISLDENLLRKSLRNYEINAAIADSVARGAALETIAEGSGQDLAWVQRQLRLGTLDPEIFAAYRDGKITEDQAQAFAATDDRALQSAAWGNFRGKADWEASPAKIRAWYKVGDAQLARNLLFVGEAVYRGKGGGFELDLFADRPGERGRITHEGLLAQLVQEKRASVCALVRRNFDCDDLVFLPEPPKFGTNTDHTLAIDLKGKARLPREAGPGDIVATIEIDRDGEWQPLFWWASRKAKAAAAKPKKGQPASSPARSSLTSPDAGEALSNTGGAYDQAARAIVRDEHGLTADGLQAIRSVRRAILRGLLFLDAQKGGTLARDWLTWSQLRMELAGSHWRATGARPLASDYAMHGMDREDADAVGPQLRETVAETVWQEQLGQVAAMPFMALEDESDAFLDFVSQPDEVKRQAEALLAGCALIRSANTPGYRIPVHDTLAQLAGGADPGRIRMLWEPGPLFAGLFGKMHRLALAQPFVDPTAFKDWHRLQDKPLAGAVGAALQGVEGGDRGRTAKRWIHPLLAFGEADPVAAEEEAAEELEAAE